MSSTEAVCALCRQRRTGTGDTKLEQSPWGWVHLDCGYAYAAQTQPQPATEREQGRQEERERVCALLEGEAAQHEALAAEWAADYPKIGAGFETLAVKLRLLAGHIRDGGHWPKEGA